MEQIISRSFVHSEEELIEKVRDLSKKECMIVIRPAAVGHEIEIRPMSEDITEDGIARKIGSLLDQILEPIRISKPHRLGAPVSMVYEELQPFLPMKFSSKVLKNMIISRGYEILPGIPLHGDYASKTAILRGYKIKNMALKDEYRNA